MLGFGLNSAIPDGVDTAWGCRASVRQDGYVDVPWDRTDAIGPDDQRRALLDYLTAHVGDAWQTKASQLLKSGEMHIRVEKVHVLFRDDRVIVKGDTRRSDGYLYVCAYQHTRPEQPASSQ